MLGFLPRSSLRLGRAQGFNQFLSLRRDKEKERLHRKTICSVGVAVSLAMHPSLAENLFGNPPLPPEARYAFVPDFLKNMTMNE